MVPKRGGPKKKFNAILPKQRGKPPQGKLRGGPGNKGRKKSTAFRLYWDPKIWFEKNMVKVTS